MCEREDVVLSTFKDARERAAWAVGLGDDQLIARIEKEMSRRGLWVI